MEDISAIPSKSVAQKISFHPLNAKMYKNQKCLPVNVVINTYALPEAICIKLKTNNDNLH